MTPLDVMVVGGGGIGGGAWIGGVLVDLWVYMGFVVMLGLELRLLKTGSFGSCT